MVRAASVRITKYDKKFDPTVVSTRFTAVRDLAIQEYTVAAADLASMEELVKNTIQDLVSNPLEIPQYLDFARELWRLTQKHSGKILVSEANISMAKWTARGLSKDVLQKIYDLFGISGVVYS